MGLPSTEPLPRDAAEAIGDPDGLRLLSSLVSIAPTNLEDPIHHRWEKPNYLRAADRIVRAAREFGLQTRIFDPVTEGSGMKELRGIPRPNVIVDLDVGATSTILVLAHYDVVPVPTEQLQRWKSPPHVLTARSNGRLYGRGSNDDLGSGVVSSLLAMKRLAHGPKPGRNVRLIVCCDEETGGEGGVEALKAHDATVAANDGSRFLSADVALIPDGAPRATAGSCGVVFVDATFDRRVSLSETIAFGEELVALHERVRTWKSQFASPDWPAHNAPEPVITGRATVTKWDLDAVTGDPSRLHLVEAHAETDAANQIAQAVTLLFSGGGLDAAVVESRLAKLVSPPFRLIRATSTAVPFPADALAFQLVGLSAHGGYPHRGHNPVPAALTLLGRAAKEGLLDPSATGRASFAVDLRLTPEMQLDSGRSEALTIVRRWAENHLPDARVDAPEARSRGGYWLSADHPAVVKLERLLREEFGVHGVMGEYGGTDASALAGLKTPAGTPLPALVFGSMDREAHIHEAEESVDPKNIAKVSKTIERYVREA